jgi:hypothetical protein
VRSPGLAEALLAKVPERRRWHPQEQEVGRCGHLGPEPETRALQGKRGRRRGRGVQEALGLRCRKRSAEFPPLRLHHLPPEERRERLAPVGVEGPGFPGREEGGLEEARRGLLQGPSP